MEPRLTQQMTRTQHGIDSSIIFWDIWHVLRHFSNTKLLISMLVIKMQRPSNPLSLTREGHNDILVKLIEKGADVSAKGSNGRTPLLMTAKSGRVECMKTLLHHGAQINSTDDENDTALTLASYVGHMAYVEALLEHETVDIPARDKDERPSNPLRLTRRTQ